MNPDQFCFACGYDLRGTIAAGRSQCPECGAVLAGIPESEDQERRDSGDALESMVDSDES